jgi:hypothetical protein
MKGSTPDDPIECEGVEGEQKYIGSLRCPSGQPYDYRRIRAVPVRLSPEDILMVDEYEISCKCGQHSRKIYFDMYHGALMGRLGPRRKPI